MKETRIMDWFIFDAVMTLIVIIGTSLTTHFGLTSENMIGQGLAILGFGSIMTFGLSFGWMVLCAASDLFPSGIQSYCRYYLFKLVFIFILSFLFNILVIKGVANTSAEGELIQKMMQILV